jgi:hypothetical protein
MDISPLARKTIIEMNALHKYKKKEICKHFNEDCLNAAYPELCWFDITEYQDSLYRCPIIE